MVVVLDLDPADDETVATVVTAHDPQQLTPEQQAAADDAVNLSDIKAQLQALNLMDKTPLEIATAMQTRIGNWSSLADARTDLSAWLPLMAWGIARLLKDK